MPLPGTSIIYKYFYTICPSSRQYGSGRFSKFDVTGMEPTPRGAVTKTVLLRAFDERFGHPIQDRPRAGLFLRAVPAQWPEAGSWVWVRSLRNWANSRVTCSGDWDRRATRA